MPNSRNVEAVIASIESLPVAAIVTDSRELDNPILAANEAFCHMTGYSTDEIIGRNCRFLSGVASEPGARTELRSAVAQGRSAVVELWNYRKDGSAFRNAVMVTPICNDSGEPDFFLGTQMALKDHVAQGFGSKQARRTVLALTSKQRQVLKMMTNGSRDRRIAERLGIGSSAVKRLRKRLLEKLGVPSAADAIRIGVQAGLVSESEDSRV